MQHQLSVSLRSSLVEDTTTPFTRRQERFQFPAVTSGLASLQIDHKVKLYNIAVTDTHCHDPLKIDILDVETHVLRRVTEEVVLVDVVRLEDRVEGGEDGKAGVADGSEAWK